MDVQELIRQKHSGDQDQIDVIFSNDHSIIVTAPAGCGKTTTMISKIAWELSSGHIAPNKKILAMTYSVAGAMKIRDSLKKLLPSLVENADQYLSRVDVSNYHQFAMRLLCRYGYVLHENMRELYDFQIVDEESSALFSVLIEDERNVLKNFKYSVTKSNDKLIKDNFKPYWTILQNKLIPKKQITYNGILVSAIVLLQQYKQISEFYQKFYQMIIIDEFQDTNYLGYYFLRKLSGSNRTVFMGDDIQRIYGFIGAVSDLFAKVKLKYVSKEFTFRTNYRFPTNPGISALDTLFRDYGEHYQASSNSASMNLNVFNNNAQEVDFIVNGISNILDNTEDNAAILVRAGYQGNDLAKALDGKKIKYFNCLYKETDLEFERFYAIAIEEFHRAAINGKAVIRSLKNCLNAVESREADIVVNASNKYIFDSLFSLLKILFSQAKLWDCSPEERYNQIDFTLGNNGLKHMMEYMDERIVLSTIHSAKGLEWQYVIVPGLVSYSFPTSAICKPCRSVYTNCNEGHKYCKCLFDPGMEKAFKEEISVFYVALTRAKKDVFFTANTGKNQWGYPKKTSCIVNLPGVNVSTYNWKSII